MRYIEKVLQAVEDSIQGGIYHDVETEKIELKDLSTSGDWKELHKSACAFLNTQGGIIIVGIKERIEKDLKYYKFTGLNYNDEPKIKEISRQFTDEKGVQLDLSEYFPNPEILDFAKGKVAVIYVEKLPDTRKYVFFKGKAYQRKLTGDSEISSRDISQQEELKKELEYAKELEFVQGATLKALDVEKLNEYILRLNKDVKIETLKPNLESAMPFLTRKKFVINEQPTLLGLLVCAENPYDFLQGRCQVDGYVNTGAHIAENKKVFKDNIISLMESAIAFVYRNTATGIAVTKGGETIYEYPERLIRETINNALAHRDYSSDRFVNITISPNRYLEIRNPGRFPSSHILRDDFNGGIRLRRIIPATKPKNPRLADVLKTYDRWEGKGWGMSSLANEALANRTDLPYYIFHTAEDISLIIPKGQIFDEDMKFWLNAFSGYIKIKTNGKDLTIEQKTVLAYFYKSEKANDLERYTVLLNTDNNHFSVIRELENYSLIFRHNQSPELYPIYYVDRELMKNDFTNELRAIFGGNFDSLGNDWKDVLNVVYLFNTYAEPPATISARQAGEFLYFKKHKKVLDIKDFDRYLRSVRRIMNLLESSAFVTRAIQGKPQYILNKNIKRQPSLFD